MSLGENLRSLLEERGMTQKELAKKLNVKRSTYTMWELGDVNFPIEKIVEIAKLFHTNVDYLLDLTTNKEEVLYPEQVDNALIGRKLKEFRTKTNKTQKEFAYLLGIRQSTYFYYEEGRNRIPTEKLILLAKTYRIPVSKFCGGKKKAKESITTR